MAKTEKKVLIIDPDHNQRTVMASFLKSENYTVESGENLTDAIRILHRSRYRCLILDVDLPEMKGYDAVSVLKSIQPDIRIIMTSKDNSRDLEARVREQDIFFYFIKSFGKDELKLAIQNAFSFQ